MKKILFLSVAAIFFLSKGHLQEIQSGAQTGINVSSACAKNSTEKFKPSKNDIVYHTRSFAIMAGYLFGTK